LISYQLSAISYQPSEVVSGIGIGIGIGIGFPEFDLDSATDSE
jgi:hypothetical protein